MHALHAMGKLTGLTSPSAFIIDGGKSVLNHSFAIIEPGTSWYTAGIKTDCVLHARPSTAWRDTHGIRDQSTRASQHQSMHPFLVDRSGPGSKDMPCKRRGYWVMCPYFVPWVHAAG